MVPGRSPPSAVVVVVTLAWVALALPFATAAEPNAAAARMKVACGEGCEQIFLPVCGSDSRTYSSRCLATCQGVRIQQDGPCPGEALLHPSNMEHIAKDHASSVGVAQLYAFADQGFLYHGQMRFTRSDFERPEANNTRRTDGSGVHAAGAGAGREGSAGGAAAEARPGAAEQGAMRALRITRDGHLYSADMADLEATARAALAALNAGSGVAAEGSAGGARNQRPTHGSQGSGRAQGPGSEINALRGVAEAAEGEVVIPGGLADGVASSGGSAQGVEDAYPDPLTTTTRGHAGGRRLQGIFGPDDRIDCPRTLTYPFTSIGQINIKDKLGSYVCSGALIGPDVVLTAAHCVFSRANQGFYEGLSFAPSRYLKEDGGAVDPYGMVPWTYVTIYQGYSAVITPDPNVWDMAVIKLTAPIGLSAGWMGVYEPCGEASPVRYVAHTAGYPSDMPAGSCKFTQCAVSQSPCTDAYLYHKCDTASGQSGSPMWMLAMTPAKKMGPYIRAVHNIEWVQSASSGGSESYINSAVSITPDHYRTVLAWVAPSWANATFAAAARSAPLAPTRPLQ